MTSPIENRESKIENDSLVTSESPWPGLSSFTEDAREFFFGREKETDELVRFIRRSTLTVLFGQSGLGKSSLLQAGVFPLLREGDFLPLYLRLDHGPESPPLAEQVKSALIAAFASAHADAPGFGVSETLWEYFHRKDVDIWSAKNRLLTPVLAFDQFEEIFTLGRTDQAARDRSRAFLDELACLVENRAPAAVRERLDRGELDPSRFNFDKPSCQVVLSLREDFLPDLEGLKQEMPTLVHNRMRLKRLNGEQALEIVSRPAPHLLAEGVPARIVEFVAGARGGSIERLAELDVEPPLLSVICRELNERRRALGQAQITADLVSGNRREILTDFYERSVADLPAPMRGFVEDRLLTKSGFRDNLALETALEEPGVTRGLLDTLVGRRLLRIEDRLGTQRVELTHDVLAEVIRASRDSRQQRLALEAAKEHEQRAVALAARRVRRQRLVIAALAVAVTGLSIGAFFGIRAQALAAKQASQADLQFASQALAGGRTSEGLAYLVRAARRDPKNPIFAPRILSELVNHSFLLPEGPPIPLPSPALGFGPKYSADGRRVFFQGEDGVIRVLDTATWKIAHEFRFEQKVLPYYWSLAAKNDNVLAVGLEDGSIVVCDSRTGVPLAVPLRPADAEVSSRLNPVLSPDGRSVAAARSDGNRRRVLIWDVATGSQTASVEAFGGDFVFSPDSRMLLTVVGIGGNFALSSVTDGTQVKDFGRQGAFGGEFSPDGKSLAVVNAVGSVGIFALSEVGPPTLKILTGSVGGTGSIGGIFTPDGQRLIVTRGRAVFVFDVARGSLAYPPLSHGGQVYEPVLSRDGRLLLTNCADGLARLWDLDSGRLLAEPTLQQSQYAPAALSPDGDQILLFTSAGPAHRLRVGRSAAESLALPTSYQNSRSVFLPGPPDRALRLVGNRAVAIDVATGRETAGGFAYPVNLGVAVNIRTFLSPDQRTIVARQGGSSGEIAEGRGWFAWRRDESGKVVSSVSLDESSTISSFAFHPTENVVVSSEGRGLKILNLQTGKTMAHVEVDQALIPGSRGNAVFSPDGGSLGYLAQDDAVHVRDYPVDRERYVLRGSERAGITSWRFSPDGTCVITADDWGGVQFWRAGNGELIRGLPRHRATTSIGGFSPDGRRFLSWSDDGTVQVWELATRSPVGSLLVHQGAVVFAVFSPDAGRIATLTAGGQVRLWDAATGQPITEPMLHQGSAGFRGGGGDAFERLEFSPDGRFLMSRGTANEVYRVWSVPPSAGNVPAPQWLLRLATICASQRLTDNGEFVSAADEVARIDEVRREIAALPADAPFVEWGRWFLSDSANRSIAPGFTVTPAEAKTIAEEMAAPDPVFTLRQSSNQLRNQRKWAEAEVLDRQTLEMVRARDGEESKDVSDELQRLALTLLRGGKFAEAESEARACLAMQAKFYYDFDIQIGSARSVLGEALKALQRYPEAETHLLAAHAGMSSKSILTPLQRTRLTQTAVALAELYAATNQPGKAAEWRSKAAAPAAAPANPAAAPAPDSQPAPGGATPANAAPAAPNP